MKKVEICKFSVLKDKVPHYALVEEIDLVVVRYDDQVSVLYGRCHHRGALLADGYIDGDNIICGVHNWDYRYDTGVSEYNNEEMLHKFTTVIEDDSVFVDLDEIQAYRKDNPPVFNRDEYLGAYADTHPEDTEPYTLYIKELAKKRTKELWPSWSFREHGR
jgi:nitrite reductase/ring-hydroxylating ferredoxin subunit